MKSNLQQRVVAAFAAALLILFIVAAESIRNLVRIDRTTAQVAQIYDTHAGLAELIGHLRDVETGQRGFVITGDEVFLEPYHAALDSVDMDWLALREVIADDPVQLARLDTLTVLAGRRLAISRQIVEVRRQHGFDVAAAAVAHGTGMRAMDGIRGVVARMMDHEAQLLARRGAEQRNSVGRATHVSVAGFVLAFAIGVAAMLGMRRDIGRRVEAERRALQAKEEAEAANRAKSDFLARMSHELRTPLNSIIGFSAILLKNKAGSLPARELSYLDRVQANGRHLLGLIDDILDLSKVEAQRVDLELAPVQLDVLVRETLTQMEDRTQGRPVALRADLPASVAPLHTDAGKVKQVLINLVGNALKFTETGTVRVLLAVEPGTGRPLRLDVTDTGIGIPEHRLDAIFAAFEQADRSTTRQFGGTGLGLTISRALCTLMGYPLRVRSTVGQGTTFSILFDPAAPLPDHRPEAAPAEPPVCSRSDGTPLVLVIDDEADSRTLLAHVLQESGCQVVLATSAEEGVRLARACRPDVITLDLLMAPRSGAEVLAELARDPALAGVPVVVVSVVAQDARGWSANEIARVQKPVVREELLDALDRALEGRPVRRRGEQREDMAPPAA